jgi:hypothetical protein
MDLSIDFDGDLDNDDDDLQMLFDSLGTCLGDANLDGVVELADLQILSDNWGNTDAYWSEGDLNGDGIVELADLQILSDYWGGTGSMPTIITTPEPTTVSLLAIGSLALLCRKKKDS